MASSDVKLPYRYLGSSGLKVSTLCLGAMTFGQREVGNKCTLQNVNIIGSRLLWVWSRALYNLYNLL